MINAHDWLGVFQVLLVIAVTLILLGATAYGILDKWRDVKLDIIQAEHRASSGPMAGKMLPWGGEVK